MEQSIKLFLSEIQSHPHYNDFLELVEINRPRVPLFDFKKGNEDEWKVRSGQQQGFDLFASLLNITIGD